MGMEAQVGPGSFDPFAASSSGSGGADDGGGRRSASLLNEHGEGTVFYPSGRIALTACRSPDGYFHTFTANADRFQVLACFDSDGLGGVNHPDGRPWLVVTREGWSLSSPGGRIEQGGRWPRTGKREPISLQASPALTVEFVDRQAITARLKLGGFDRTFQCGESSRRPRGEGSYLDKVVGKLPGGRLGLDVAAIRRRIEAVGSVYVPRGPHHLVTAQPGLGNLRSMLARVAADSPIAEIVAGLDASQARVQRINTLKVPTYGTARPGKPLEEPPPADAGAPEPAQQQRSASAGLKRADAHTPPPYNLRRLKLPEVSDAAELDARIAGPGAPKDTLIAVCVLADWNPLCGRLEHQHLEAAHYELSQAASAGAGADAASARADAAHCRAVRADASGAAACALQGRYGFKTAPMFLYFFEGRLVAAGNDVRCKEDFLQRSLAALAAGRRGDALPAGFTFAGADNSMLDCITQGMTLRRAGGA